MIWNQWGWYQLIFSIPLFKNKSTNYYIYISKCKHVNVNPWDDPRDNQRVFLMGIIHNGMQVDTVGMHWGNNINWLYPFCVHL
jgi:hypothetical protein